MLDSLQARWEKIAPGFKEWFVSTVGKSILESYLLPIRQKVGMMGRVTNNDSECLNAIIREKMRGKQHPVQEIIEKLQTFIDRKYSLNFFVIRDS